ncbi:MAG TPA: hypothetical protein PK306_10850 [Aquabacterium sp.]|nr:hypothetical protein [Aquabacterium sp.]
MPTALHPPLNLALPRGAVAPWRGRNPALDDAHSNTPRSTLEARMAKELGGPDHIVEERLGDGSVRFRRGDACVVVRPNQAERLDPWNASVLPKARGVEKC